MYTSDLSRRIPKKKLAARYLFSLGAIVFLLVIFFFSVYIQSFDSSGLLIFLMLGFLGIALGYTWYDHAAWKGKWGEMAQQLGLTYSEERKGASLISLPVIKGTYKAHPVKFDTFVRGYGKQRRYYTEIQVLLTTPPIAQGLKIERATWFNRIGKAVGSKTSNGRVVVETIDPELNRRFIIQSRPETFSSQVLASASLQQGLEELAQQAWEMNLTVEQNALWYFERERIRDTEYLQAVLDLLIEMVGQVERVSR
ncbi:MAG TPA: hypothetical protein PK530_18120 [Anaerolineales bacterium]|nr:hypothetical protein [Anaerolineales bacterium]